MFESNEINASGLLSTLAGLPAAALVPVAFVREALGAGNGASAAQLDDELVDLNVDQVAELLRRSGNQVRHLCASGAIAGAYKLRGAWRVSRADLRAYQDRARAEYLAARQAKQQAGDEAPPSARTTRLAKKL